MRLTDEQLAQPETLEGTTVSNPDADHIGGFLDVIEAFEVATVYVSGTPKEP